MTTSAATAVVIVTGGSCGTGREVVRMLARRGFTIVVVYLDDQSSAEATVEEIFAADGTAVVMLASERTANVTGVNYVIDGGLIKTT